MNQIDRLTMDWWYAKLKHRWLCGGPTPAYLKWACVKSPNGEDLADVVDLNQMFNIIKYYTEGKFYIGGTAIYFENAQDATAFQLAHRWIDVKQA